MNRMIFLICPNGHGTIWAVDHAKSFFELPEKTITFRFGFTINLDLIGYIKPFNRIVETIKVHQSTFPEFTFVYCGWELIECVDDLYEKFPEAEFFIATKTFMEDKFQGWLKDSETPRSQLNLDCAGIRKHTLWQFEKIDDFLKEKEYATLSTDLKFSSINFKKFQGIYVSK